MTGQTVSFKSLQDQCRSAAFGDLPWNSLLESICHWVDGDKAMFFSSSPSGSYQVPYSFNFDLSDVKRYNSGLNQCDPRLNYSKRTLEGMTKTGQQYVLNDDLKGTAYYNEVYVPKDIGDSLHSVILDSVQTGRQALSIHRSFQKEPFQSKDIEKMQALLPYLIDAYSYSVSVACHIGKKTYDKSASALINSDLLVAPLTGNLSKVLSDCELLKCSGNFLRPGNQTIKEYLSVAIGHAKHGQKSSAKLKLETGSSVLDLNYVSLTIQKIPDAIGWMNSDEDFVMIQTSIERENTFSLNAEIFAGTFKLTLAEQRLIGCLQAEDDLRLAAARCDISYETARWHVKNILQKTLYPRRQDLIRAVCELDLSNAK